MKTFTIDEQNNTRAHRTAEQAEAVLNAERFRNEPALAKIAAEWPMARLVTIWNALPGVTPVNKFKDRPTAVARIWKQIQNLSAPEEAQPEHAAGTKQQPEVVAISAAEPETATEVAGTATVAPQGANVAPKGTPPTKKATRVKKTPAEPKSTTQRSESKTAQVIAMLKRKDGTTVEEIMSTMGWQKHTTRALLSAGGAITKKHGLAVVTEKIGEQRRHFIKG